MIRAELETIESAVTQLNDHDLVELLSFIENRLVDQGIALSMEPTKSESQVKEPSTQQMVADWQRRAAKQKKIDETHTRLRRFALAIVVVLLASAAIDVAALVVDRVSKIIAGALHVQN